MNKEIINESVITDEVTVDEGSQTDGSSEDKVALTSQLEAYGLTQEDIDKINSTVEQPADESTEEPTETDKAETDEQTNESVDESFIEVKYLGEMKQLTKDQALEYAQIGMNQGRLQTKFDNLKNSDGQKWLEEQANEFGMENVSDLIAAFKQSKLDSARKAFDEKHYYLEKQELEDLWKTHSAEEQRSIDKIKADSKAEAEKIQAEKLEFDYNLIKSAHGIEKNDVPESVIKSAEKENISVADAYNRYFMEELLPKLKEDIRNEALSKVNKNKATTSQPLNESPTDTGYKGTGMTEDEFNKMMKNL